MSTGVSTVRTDGVIWETDTSTVDSPAKSIVGTNPRFPLGTAIPAFQLLYAFGQGITNPPGASDYPERPYIPWPVSDSKFSAVLLPAVHGRTLGSEFASDISSIGVGNTIWTDPAVDRLLADTAVISMPWPDIFPIHQVFPGVPEAPVQGPFWFSAEVESDGSVRAGLQVNISGSSLILETIVGGAVAWSQTVILNGDQSGAPIFGSDGSPGSTYSDRPFIGMYRNWMIYASAIKTESDRGYYYCYSVPLPPSIRFRDGNLLALKVAFATARPSGFNLIPPNVLSSSGWRIASIDTSALRLNQRDDGLALSAHPRLSGKNGPTSASSSGRVGGTNTYN